ncbi:hypothetical protein AA101099_1981 [Neoasaia chiangmaiensis NBRC 101099]|uniref:Uncharacterized protein n=1 Tax=Neoasaia chiangmaiensis TaxID=320497 RepID=A0A1U9KT40_9PROT|nr:TIGR02300 family protein [Neoasaia chiangmaiensis]AQS89006.1 hypothetical protein A0U93_15000 [Neoasaia chiangmaiensis]GBR40153.1 hypothetical protein AA101099_1981 [Neoasaia chiangmaiensis NBRC 101099]GEN14033.1 hypothetical protein NCH01_04640 [Neoasaia chiangmaiensis]
MAQPELGLKRVCVSCGARFYDLNRNPAVCPKCGAEQPTDIPRPKRAGDIPQDQAKPSQTDQNDDDVDLDTDDENADDVMEDTSDLDDDDDDLGNDIEVNTDNDEHEN